MSIDGREVEELLESCGFMRTRTTKKVVEYRSSTNAKTIYFRTEIGIPRYIRIVVNPLDAVMPLLAVPGVTINESNEFQHGSNMTAFPKQRNDGVDKIHYGRALNIDSMASLAAFASAFHRLPSNV